ncbi:hypothetical protein ACVWV0_001672 [Ewingella americana]
MMKLFKKVELIFRAFLTFETGFLIHLASYLSISSLYYRNYALATKKAA